MKGKKDIARTRAHLSSTSVAIGPTHSLKITTSSPNPTSFAASSKCNYGISSRGDRGFLFTSTTRKKLGNELGGDCSKGSSASEMGNDFGNSDVRRSENSGESCGEEEVGDRVNSHMGLEQQAHQQASASVSTHCGVQLSLLDQQGGDGYT